MTAQLIIWDSSKYVMFVIDIVLAIIEVGGENNVFCKQPFPEMISIYSVPGLAINSPPALLGANYSLLLDIEVFLEP